MVGDPREPGRGDENYLLALLVRIDYEVQGRGAVLSVHQRCTPVSPANPEGQRSAVFQAVVTVITHLEANDL